MRHERDHDQTAMHAEASIQAQSALKGALATADQRAETAELALQDALAKVDLTTKWEEDSSHEAGWWGTSRNQAQRIAQIFNIFF